LIPNNFWNLILATHKNNTKHSVDGNCFLCLCTLIWCLSGDECENDLQHFVLTLFTMLDWPWINNMLDAVSLMPKRSINNTVAKVYKSDTTVKGNLSRDTSQQLIPVSFRLAHFHCEPHIPFLFVQWSVPPRLFNTTTND
jgi:hypothetical protein